MNGDHDNITVIGKEHGKQRVVRKESEIFAQAPEIWRALKAGTTVKTYRKHGAATNKAHRGIDYQKIAKIDRENEVTPPPKVSTSVGSAIKQARDEKKLTQKDCAQKISEKLCVLQDYESGKAIPDVKILSKLEQLLNVKLRGPNVGKRLERPKRP